MKKRLKNKLKLIKKTPNKIERLFNEARGRGIAHFKHKDSDLVMMSEEEYKKMLGTLEESKWLIHDLMKDIN